MIDHHSKAIKKRFLNKDKKQAYNRHTNSFLFSWKNLSFKLIWVSYGLWLDKRDNLLGYSNSYTDDCMQPNYYWKVSPQNKQ